MREYHFLVRKLPPLFTKANISKFVKGEKAMKAMAFAAGMAAAAAAVCAMYPDVSRRAVRDSKRIIKIGKRTIDRMCCH